MTAPSPAWLTEHTAVVEAVLDVHRVDKSGTCAPLVCGWRGPIDGPIVLFLAAHRAHVATAITAALAAEAEKGGAS